MADMFPPTSNWQRPAELPDLRRVDQIAIDSEEKDDRLRASMGSGWPHRMGHVCGISVAWRADGKARGLYAPMRHPDSDNFEPNQVYQWLRDHVAAGVRFVMHNGSYDWGWFRAESGIVMPPGDRLDDTLFMAVMVDENRFTFRLDDLCRWRALPGKDERLLTDAVCALIGSKKRKGINVKEYIWQLPARYVGPYAEQDPVSTLLLTDSLAPILEQEGTQEAYRLECDLMPMVQEMRWRGVRIDLAAAERNRDLLLTKRDAALAELSKELGTAVSMDELRDKKWLVAQFDKAKVKYPRTEKGNPSFTGGKAGWMDGHAHPLPRLKAIAHRYDNAAVTHGYSFDKLLSYAVNGRLHGEIHQLKSEDAANGAVSCRIIYSNPPLQQMPSRDDEMAPLFRGIFLPEEGEVWAAPDVSQQEFRFAVHFADQHHLRDADNAARRYQENPDADFHALVGEMTELSRGDAKQVNFGKIYGMGPQKFADVHKKTLEEAKALFAQYDRKLPFLKLLSDLYQRHAVRDGHVTIYDGARRHFNRWAPGGTWSKGAGPCELEEADRRKADPAHPWYRQQLYRIDTKDALNATVQGSAARHTKLWMRSVWREGIAPLLQLHDALHCSVSSREQGETIARLGEEAVRLRVPMRVELKFGRTWGAAKYGWSDIPKAPTVEPSPTTPTHIWRSKDTDFPVTLTGGFAAYDGEPLVEVIYRDKDGEHRTHAPKAEVLTIEEAKAPPEHPCVAFFRVLHGATTGPIFVTSLPNKRDPKDRPPTIATRDLNAIARFARDNDKSGRALYYAVNALATGQTWREKNNMGECAALFADLDGKGIACTLDEALNTLNTCACPPTIIVRSGHGLHPLWVLHEPAKVQRADGHRCRAGGHGAWWHCRRQRRQRHPVARVLGMVTSGYSDEEIIERLLDATMAAAERAGLNWDVEEEKKNIRAHIKRKRKRVAKEKAEAAAKSNGAGGPPHFVVVAPDPPPSALAQPGNDGRPVLNPKALYGLAGEVVEKILPTTEADAVALLIQTLTAFGCVIGRGPHFIVQETAHYTNINAMLVGPTSLGRKGTSANRVFAPFRHVDRDWYLLRIANGLSSGEGLIKEVRDPQEKWDNKKEEMVLIDEGVDDKRLLVLETEFSMPLVAAKRSGNVLMRIVREMWDGKEVIRTMVSQSPLRATGAHVSIVGHITRDELLLEIDTNALMNGVVNRFLIAVIDRSKELPFGGESDENTTRDLGEKLSAVVNVVRNVGLVGMTDEAREMFAAAYHDLSAGRPGLFGGAVARGPAQVRRLAMIYALLDRQDMVDVPHLEAALALWQYCLSSAEILFGDATGNQNADMIRRALKNASPAGMSRSDISNLFGRHLSAAALDAALTVLFQSGKARSAQVKPPGRGGFTEMWFAV